VSRLRTSRLPLQKPHAAKPDATTHFAWISTRLATYPLEVVKPRVSPKANASFKGDQLDAALDAVPRLRAKARRQGKRVAHRSPRQGDGSSHIRVPSWANSVTWVLNRIDICLGICQNPEDLPASRQMTLGDEQ
jgi:hypothetical protein